MKNFGSRRRIRTDTCEGLNLMPLPVGLDGLKNFGSGGGIRTHNNWFLRPTPLPIGTRRHIYVVLSARIELAPSAL